MRKQRENGFKNVLTYVLKCYGIRKYVQIIALCILCTVLFFLTYWQYHWLNSSCHCHKNSMFMLSVQFFSAWSKKCMLWYMEMKTNIVVLNWSLVRFDLFCCTFLPCDAKQRSVLFLFQSNNSDEEERREIGMIGRNHWEFRAERCLSSPLGVARQRDGVGGGRWRRAGVELDEDDCKWTWI